MRVVTPDNKTIFLDDKADLDERMKIVKQLTEQYQEYYDNAWETNSVKFFLDRLSTYVNTGFKEKYTHDKEVLSLSKLKKMNRGDKRVRNFSDLSLEKKVRLGLSDPKESQGEY